MKKDENIKSRIHMQRVTIMTTRIMIWASLSAFIINGAWFFFDDFFKTMFQELIILSAVIASIVSMKLAKNGLIIRAIRIYAVFGLLFGIVITWSAGDSFLYTGIFILSISSLIEIFSLKRKEAVFWSIFNYFGAAVGLFLRNKLNIWGSGYTGIELFQLFLFNSIVMGALVLFGYKISNMLRRSLKKTKKRNEEIAQAARQLSEKNDELYRLSSTDILTGLNNRMKLDIVLGSEIERAARYKKAFSIVIIDIDHFKKVNDTFGHQVGDSVLKNISNLMLENLRSSDIAGRWGGEEFMIICPETDLESVNKLSEKIRAVIEKERILDRINITASFGTAQYVEGDSSYDLIKKADTALYNAKLSGRNRIHSYAAE